MGFLFYFIFLWALDYIYFKLKYSRPNGPPVWYFFPFVGVLPFYLVPKSLFKRFWKYYLRNFPDVILTRHLWVPCVFVKHSAVQDVQNSPHCLSRVSFETVLGTLTVGRSSLFFNDNNDKECPWQSIRKTNLSALNFLPRKQKFRKTADVVDHFLRTIEEHEGQLWNMKESLTLAKYQETSSLHLGRAFETNVMQNVGRAVTDLLEGMAFCTVIFFLVPLRVIMMLDSVFPLRWHLGLSQRVYAKVARRLVEEKTEPIGQPRDFVDAVLRLKSREDAVNFLRETLFVNMMASTHTTHHTTVASLAYISLNERVQRKIHEELDRVVGSSSLSADHLDNLHYLKAAIYEAFRLNPPLPTVLRLTTGPTEIGGYAIKSDMVVATFILSENIDPRNFPQPYDFIPERHINADGVFESSKLFDIFSRGKRRCSGIETANLSVQVFCAKILQHFRIFPENSNVEVPGYSGWPLSDCPSIPLRFVRREGAPAIEPPALETGLAAFVEGIIQEETESL